MFFFPPQPVAGVGIVVYCINILQQTSSCARVRCFFIQNAWISFSIIDSFWSQPYPGVQRSYCTESKAEYLSCRTVCKTFKRKTKKGKEPLVWINALQQTHWNMFLRGLKKKKHWMNIRCECGSNHRSMQLLRNTAWREKLSVFY